VVETVNQYIESRPDPAVYDFLPCSFDELTARHGGVAGTAFRGFPSYPQRYTEVLNPQPDAPADVTARVEPLKMPRITKRFTEDDRRPRVPARHFAPPDSHR
jgi:hypothetical protein